ncbi:hypothetical protein NPIL_18741 [Nephila pilipes]|uniref:Uncharacterized protein n=1 Tax=Nephila pilipes TaxID=299642 RepID=A0A8X6ULX7_NEPPI|nr:hypothetical protein NPIL_18741 [Nephila pilipes]
MIIHKLDLEKRTAASCYSFVLAGASSRHLDVVESGPILKPMLAPHSDSSMKHSLEQGRNGRFQFLLVGWEVLVLDVKNSYSHPSGAILLGNPTHKYPFGEELDIPSIAEKISSNSCPLREGNVKV